jgi:hypothetical protein
MCDAARHRAPHDIRNLVNEQSGVRSEPAVLSFVMGPEGQDLCGGKLISADDFLQKQQKQRGRPFEKGRSGNPAGRRPGSRNRSTQAAQLLLEGEAEASTRRPSSSPSGGDPAALRCVSTA